MVTIPNLGRKIKNSKLRNGAQVIHTFPSGVSIIMTKANNKITAYFAVTKTGKSLSLKSISTGSRVSEKRGGPGGGVPPPGMCLKCRDVRRVGKVCVWVPCPKNIR